MHRPRRSSRRSVRGGGGQACQVRRIDLADMREDWLELPSVVSNIAIDKRTNTMFCLSRVVDRIYRVKVDVTQMVKIDFTKFADSSGCTSLTQRAGSTRCWSPTTRSWSPRVTRASAQTRT